MEASRVLPKKAFAPIEVMAVPNVTEVRCVLFRKVAALNVVKPFPKVTEDNDEAPEKALVPTDVTELGITIEVRCVAPEKALTPIEVKELGSVKEVIPVQP